MPRPAYYLAQAGSSWTEMDGSVKRISTWWPRRASANDKHVFAVPAPPVRTKPRISCTSSAMRFVSGMRRGYPTGGDVLFVYDEPGAWTRYRCDHAVEQLRLCGVLADAVQSSSADLSIAADRYGSLVLNRVAWTDELGALLARARARGQSVLFDTDDLVFEPDLIGHLAAFDGWPERDRLQEAQKLARYRRTLEACDAATVTTEPLAEFAREHVAHVEVVHNVVSDG